MQSIILSQAPTRQPDIVKQRIITSEEEKPIQAGQVSKPVPSFIYFILAILLVVIAIWAIIKFKAPDIPKTLLTKQVNRSLAPVKRVKK